MIYIILGLIVYSLILTMFVVRISNRMDEMNNMMNEINKTFDFRVEVMMENKLKHDDRYLKTTFVPLQPDESFIGNIPPIPPADLFLNEPPNLNQAADQIDKLLNNTSKEEIDKWLNEKPQQDLKSLNKDYKSY